MTTSTIQPLDRYAVDALKTHGMFWCDEACPTPDDPDALCMDEPRYEIFEADPASPLREDVLGFRCRRHLIHPLQRR